MRKIIDYKIIYHFPFDELDKAVKEMIGDGWQPLGGLVFTNGGLTQAMVKYEDEEQVQIE